MFKKQRQFNIITGQISKIPLTRRSLSCGSQFQNLQKASILKSKIPRLGDPKDKKQFQYSYFDFKPNSDFPLIGQIKNSKKSDQVSNLSMLNYVSSKHNIINHKEQIETAKVVDSLSNFQKMPNFFKKSPLTEHIHSARKCAPNYHDNYQLRTQKNQFYRKVGLCSSICGIQKTYGPARYFRKFK